MIKLNKQGSRWWPYEISSAFFNKHKTQSSTSFAHPSHYINELSTHKQLSEQKKCCLITGPDPQLTQIGLPPFRSEEMENLYHLNIGLGTCGKGRWGGKISSRHLFQGAPGLQQHHQQLYTSYSGNPQQAEEP